MLGKIRLATSVAGAAILCAGAAQAQVGTPAETASAAPADPSAKAPEAGDIIVTAQFRTQRLQDVPIAVSAVSGEALKDAHVRSLEDLSAAVPSFSVAANSNYGAAPLSLRGVGGANGGGNVFADEPVAVYFDGAVVSRPRYASLDLVDVESVEVLRGPQGTLYGRNSSAGAVLLKSGAPTRDLYGYIEGSAGSYRDFRVRGAISGPLDGEGRLLARLAVGYSDYDGWARNYDGSHLGGSRDFLVRGTLQAAPTDSLTLKLIGEYSYQNSHPALLAISDVSNLRDETTNPTGSNVLMPYTLRPDLKQLLDDRRVALNVETFTRTKGRTATLQADQVFDWATLTSITNYRDWRVRGQLDSDGTAVNPPTPAFVTGDITNVGDNGGRQFEWQWSEEARLAGSSGRFDWVVGGIYFEEHLGFGPFTIFNRLAGPGGAGTAATFKADQTTEAFAFFGNVTYKFTDSLSLTLGGRYSEERKHFTRSFAVNTILPFDPPGPVAFPAGSTLAAPPDVDTRAKFTDFSPRVVLTFQPSRDFMAYASYSQGFKSGGFNAFGGSTAFLPEGIDAYEVGVKVQALDRKLSFNTAAFSYDYSNLQVRTPVPSGGVGIETADKARVRGIEFETTLRPLDGLQLSGNLTYLDAHFTAGALSAVLVDSFVAGSNPAVGLENIDGNRLTRAPKWQGGANISYEMAAGADNRIRASLGVRFQSSVFFLETRQDADTYRAKAWGELDGRLSLVNHAGWELAVYGKNLTDNRHLSQVSSLFGLPVAAVNEPRRFGVQGRFSF